MKEKDLVWILEKYVGIGADSAPWVADIKLLVEEVRRLRGLVERLM